MNWLAKINLNTVVSRLGPFQSAILLLVLVVTCVYSGYRIGNFYHSYQMQTLEEQKRRLDNLYIKQVDQVRRIHTLEVELEVERLANQRSLALLKEMESEHYSVKKDLAFYEKVMAPEKEADGLVIDDISVWPSESPRHYRFQVTLVQQLLRKRYAKGYIELKFKGSLNDKPHLLPLAEISSQTKKDRSFSFQYFQVIEGEFTLPENFSPETVELSAILTKSKWQKYRKIDTSENWQHVLSELRPSFVR